MFPGQRHFIIIPLVSVFKTTILCNLFKKIIFIKKYIENNSRQYSKKKIY